MEKHASPDLLKDQHVADNAKADRPPAPRDGKLKTRRTPYVYAGGAPSLYPDDIDSNALWSPVLDDRVSEMERFARHVLKLSSRVPVWTKAAERVLEAVQLLRVDLRSGDAELIAKATHSLVAAFEGLALLWEFGADFASQYYQRRGSAKGGRERSRDPDARLRCLTIDRELRATNPNMSTLARAQIIAERTGEKMHTIRTKWLKGD